MGHLLACKSAASACPTTIAATPAAAEAAATKTTRESNTMMVPPILNLIIDQESGAQSAAAIATSPPPVLLPPIKQRETAARKKRARQDEGDLLIFDSPVKVVSAAASSSSPPEVSTKLQTILSNADYESPASFFNKSPKETLSTQSSSGFCDSGYYGALEDCALVTDLNNSASSGSSNSVCGSSESCEKILNAKSDCDCKKCLNDELLRIKKEIFFMYKQHQVVPNVLHHHHPSSQAVAPFSKHHHHHHQHFLHHGKRIIDFGPASTKTGIVVVEEEFEDDEFLVSTTQQDNFDKGRRSVKLNRFEDDDAEERKGGARSRRSGLETKLSSSLSSANGGSDQNETSVHMTTTTRNGDLQKPRRTHIIENELFAEHEEEEEGLEEESASNAERSVFLTRHSWSSELKPSSNSNKVQQQVVIEGNEATSLLLNSLGTGETTPIKKPQKKSAKTMRVIKSGGSGEEVSTPTTSQSSPNSHRMKRFEQFLKSLVGKKPSSGSTTSTNSSQSHSHSQKNGSTESRIVAAQVTSQAAPQVLKIDPSPSEEGNLQASFYRQHSSGSTTSLNLIAQQKFLNILPLPKRNMSVNNLTVIPEAMQRRSIGVAMATSGPECLKTNSCSFSNFEKLTATIKNEFDTNLDMRGGGGGRQGLVAPGNRRLQVSRSTNFLQSPAYLSAQLGALPIRPLNRFRNSLATSASLLEVETSEQCSRCSSLLSLAGGAGGTGSNESRASLNLRNSGAFEPVAATVTQSCKLCLGEVKSDQMTLIHMCQCTFCTDCMKAYIEFEILEGAYEISCPDAMCPSQGMLSMSEIGALATPDLLTKHHRYRLNREVEMDKNRVWCPKAGCDTVCLLDANMPSSSTSSFSAVVKSNLGVPHSVKCPTCSEEFCSACKKTWHPRISCEENTKRLAADGLIESIGIPFDNDLIKCCPMCCVPIEKDEGCAQMMCKRCKHVFCWYCLASLDDDFLLRHYDKGPCKNKLGHSRASVVWHRAQVIGIFAGFGLLLLVASPLLLLAAPCIVCCKCRICSGAAKLEEEQDIEFEDPINTLHR